MDGGRPMTTFDFSEFPILQTDRLILRKITMADLEDWFAVWNNADVLQYLIDFEADPDEDEVKEIIIWTQQIFLAKTGARWAITRKDDDTMIGSVGFHLYSANNRCAEIGYELHRDHWRKGIMSEALTAVVDFCFTQLNCHRVEANVTSGNEGSAGLLKKLGFTLEGTWRDKVYWRDAFYDLWQFGLLENEYRTP